MRKGLRAFQVHEAVYDPFIWLGHEITRAEQVHDVEASKPLLSQSVEKGRHLVGYKP